MLQFRVKNVIPPGGRYFFEVKETGVRLEDFTMSGAKLKVKAHMRENGIEVPEDLEARIEDHICRHAPEGFCFGDLDGKPRARVVTLQSVKTNTSSLQAGNSRIDIGMARTRARTCGQCKMNDRSACPSCVGMVAWARRMAGRQLGGLDEWLGVCMVDAVAIPVKVHLSHIPSNPDYPDDCWRNK